VAHWSGNETLDGDASQEVAQQRLLEARAVYQDSVRSIIEAGLHKLVEMDHQLTDEISLEPTPGHTPGHVSVRISSLGQHAIITGDMMHHPIQCAIPNAQQP
jgi:glyoxylase-like metal-dependent hydrolase (beta-lactamase superfamily II)